MNVSNKNHPHHAIWREHVQSVLDGKPKILECNNHNDLDWLPFSNTSDSGFTNALWLPTMQYRIARKMITRTITYPEPMTQPPTEGTKYWSFMENQTIADVDWLSDSFDINALKNGFAFFSQEDAQAAYDAIFKAKV